MFFYVLFPRRLVFSAQVAVQQRALGFSLRSLSISSAVTTASVIKLPPKEDVAAYDNAAVQKFATDVVGLDAVNAAVLEKIGIVGRTLLSLGASSVDRLENSGMTMNAAYMLTQAVEELRGVFRGFHYQRPSR